MFFTNRNHQWNLYKIGILRIQTKRIVLEVQHYCCLILLFTPSIFDCTFPSELDVFLYVTLLPVPSMVTVFTSSTVTILSTPSILIALHEPEIVILLLVPSIRMVSFPVVSMVLVTPTPSITISSCITLCVLFSTEISEVENDINPQLNIPKTKIVFFIIFILAKSTFFKCVFYLKEC